MRLEITRYYLNKLFFDFYLPELKISHPLPITHYHFQSAQETIEE